MKPSAYCTFDTPIGVCGIGWVDEPWTGEPLVTLFQLPESTPTATQLRIARNAGGSMRPSDPPPPIAVVIDRIKCHLAGDLQDFSAVAVDLTGVEPFQRDVYAAARSVSAGRTVNYGEIARTIGQPGSARAVGQALGRNPVALIVPCHRVLRAGGKSHGFSAHAGSEAKARLLAIEGATLL